MKGDCGRIIGRPSSFEQRFPPILSPGGFPCTLNAHAPPQGWGASRSPLGSAAGRRHRRHRQRSACAGNHRRGPRRGRRREGWRGVEWGRGRARVRGRGGRRRGGRHGGVHGGVGLHGATVVGVGRRQCPWLCKRCQTVTHEAVIWTIGIKSRGGGAWIFV